MARVGFKKTWAAGTFDKAAVQALFAHLKTYVTNAGFNVLLDTSVGIDFIRMGSPAGTADDDIPHWAFSFQDQDPNGEIVAYPVYGNNYLDAGAYSASVICVNSSLISAGEVSLWFAADGAAGWWWMHVIVNDGNTVLVPFGCAGTTSRRYPSDMNNGLCARYGVRDVFGSWYLPFAKLVDGTISAGQQTDTWSPLGIGSAFTGKRHTGSSLPRMAVPVFPSRISGSSTACILGELNEILMLTDGYAQEEVVVPGWIAMTGGNSDIPYAVPAPESFDVL